MITFEMLSKCNIERTHISHQSPDLRWAWPSWALVCLWFSHPRRWVSPPAVDLTPPSLVHRPLNSVNRLNSVKSAVHKLQASFEIHKELLQSPNRWRHTEQSAQLSIHFGHTGKRDKMTNWWKSNVIKVAQKSHGMFFLYADPLHV